MTSAVYALDFETTGLDTFDRSAVVVGVGLADSSGCCYLDFSPGTDPAGYRVFCDWAKTKRLTAFNVAFDGRWLLRDTGSWPTMIFCSFGAYRHLATEGYPEQEWDLDSACINLLGQSTSHKKRMAELLAKHGLDKSEMWRLAQLEPEEFATYCALDAEAAWCLYEYFTDFISEHYDTWGENFADFHTNQFLPICSILAQAYLRGQEIDRTALADYSKQKETEAAEIERQLFQHPLVQPWIAEKVQEAAVAHMGNPPPQYTKAKAKDGQERKLSDRWLKWKAKAELISPRNVISWTSKPDMRDLFYRFLKYSPLVLTKKKLPAVDKKMLPLLGPVGELLMRFNDCNKKHSFAKSLQEAAPSGTLHAEFKSVGCVTGRLSGGRDE